MRPPRPSTTPAPEAPTIVTISRFKVKVAEYLRQVERTGGTLIITNRGRHVATVTSAVRRPGNTFVGAGRGAIRVPAGSSPFTTLQPWGTTVSARVATPSGGATPLLAEASPAAPAAQRRLTGGQSSADAIPPSPPDPATDAGH